MRIWNARYLTSNSLFEVVGGRLGIGDIYRCHIGMLIEEVDLRNIHSQLNSGSAIFVGICCCVAAEGWTTVGRDHFSSNDRRDWLPWDLCVSRVSPMFPMGILVWKFGIEIGSDEGGAHLSIILGPKCPVSQGGVPCRTASWTRPLLLVGVNSEWIAAQRAAVVDQDQVARLSLPSLV